MEESQVTPPEDGLAGFSSEIQQDVDGLIYLGYLEDEFDFCGHSFVLRTLRGDEELLAGLVSKEFIETFGQSKATAWAHISLALVAVDGDESFCPAAGPDKRAYARGRFNYVTSNWYWPVCFYLYERYAKLIDRQSEAIQAVDHLSKRSLSPFMPFADFSTDRASSEEAAPLEDIKEFLDPEDSTDSS